MICRDCGGENVKRDAWASWNFEKQDWVLDNYFDDAFCEDCEGSTSIDEEEVEHEPSATDPRGDQ